MAEPDPMRERRKRYRKSLTHYSESSTSSQQDCSDLPASDVPYSQPNASRLSFGSDDPYGSSFTLDNRKCGH